MALDSLKSNVSDYKEKKTDLKKKKDNLSIEIEKADDLVSSSGGMDEDVSRSIKDVRKSFDTEEVELYELDEELEKEGLDLKRQINSEQVKLSSAQKKIDNVAGKKYSGGLDLVSKKCDDMLAELDDMLADIEGGSDDCCSLDTVSKSNKIVRIDGDSYRTDDNGSIHMKRESNGEYHVLPNTHYVSNGYSYQTDEQGRIVHVEGTIKVRDGGRDSLNAKVADMGPDDQRGHIIGDLLRGSNQNDNLVAQLKTVNQGAYKVMEMNFASLYLDGYSVYGDYFIAYDNDTKRPSSITVDYSVNNGMPVLQAATFEKLGIDNLAAYSTFENELMNLYSQGHRVDCNYSVVFSNDNNNCWISVEYSIDGGLPIYRDFKNSMGK